MARCKNMLSDFFEKNELSEFFLLEITLDAFCTKCI